MEGDLRFLSHHEMLRALELAAVRAAVPLRYSQGFNPHPILSLPAPRPVGVTGKQELLVVSLESPMSVQELLAGLGAQAPRGLRFLEAVHLESKEFPQPVRADYFLPLTEMETPLIEARLRELEHLEAWPMERQTSPKGRVRLAHPALSKSKGRPRSRAKVLRMIDIKPMITGLSTKAGRLHWSAVPHGGGWARPGEVLKLLGLDERERLAHVVRTAVEFAAAPPRRADNTTKSTPGATEAPKSIEL